VDEQLNDLGRSHLPISKRIFTSPSRPTPTRQSHGFALVASPRLVAAFDAVNNAQFQRTSHDIATFVMGDALGKVVFLPDRLALYRQHETNFTGVRRETTRAERWQSSAERRAISGSEMRQYADVCNSNARFCGELRVVPVAHIAPISAAMAESRIRMWQREAQRYERRADLYAAQPRSAQAVVLLAAHSLRGDYGPRSRYRMGCTSFARDLLHVTDTLDLTRRSFERVMPMMRKAYRIPRTRSRRHGRTARPGNGHLLG
jgi:hypothetical protein